MHRRVAIEICVHVLAGGSTEILHGNFKRKRRIPRKNYVDTKNKEKEEIMIIYKSTHIYIFLYGIESY